HSPATIVYFVAPEPRGPAGDTAHPLSVRLGTPFKLMAAYDSGRPLDALDRPARLTMRYTREDMAAAGETSLTITWWDAAQQTWVALPTSLDRPRQEVSADVRQLGLFSLRGAR
ncbi:MAG: hypothetical protein AB1791_09360, partial [Chloroflexota bacterium]